MIAKTLLTFVFVSLLFAATDVPPGGEVPDEPTLKFTYDSPEVGRLLSAEYQIATSATFEPESIVQVRKWIYAEHPETPPPGILIRDQIAMLPDATYYVRIRVFDLQNRNSDWSEPYSFIKDWLRPLAPTGCRIAYE